MKKNRWKPGKLIHLATGVRTKKYNCFKKDDCKSTQSIEVIWYEIVEEGESPLFEVKVEGRVLNLAECIGLALNDGFETLSDFLEWFNTDYTGKIIHWTNFRY
jgi:hypothetical protein